MRSGGLGNVSGLLGLLRLGVEVGHRLWFASLRDGQGTSPSWNHRERNAGEDEAREDGDRENILLDLVMASRIGESEDNVLDFVVNSAARLKGVRLGVRRQIVEVCLE